MRGKLFDILRSSRLFQQISSAPPAQKEIIHAGAASSASGVDILLHDLKTPLAGIIGMAELLSETSGQGESSHYARAVQESARQMVRLIESLRLESGLNPGRLPESQQWVQGRSFLEHIIRSHWAAASRKRLSLYLHLHHELPSRWLINPLGLRQALDNLLANAIKFTQQGYVTLEASPAGFGAESDAGLEFTITDTGRGISPLDSERIFTVREQGEGVADRYGGSGLGLHISQHIARRCGGSLEHKPVKGGGTCFRLKIPVAETRVKSSIGRLRPALLKGLDCGIRLAEPARRVVTGLLHSAGVRITPIVSGAYAEWLDGCDAVICDYHPAGHNPDSETETPVDPVSGEVSTAPRLLTRWDAVRGAGKRGECRVRCVLLPQPILRSNLEPLLLRLALRKKYALNSSAFAGVSETPGSTQPPRQAGP